MKQRTVMQGMLAAWIGVAAMMGLSAARAATNVLEPMVLGSFNGNVQAPMGFRVNFSGCCVWPATGELMVILNRGQVNTNGAIEVYSPAGAFRRHIILSGFDDTEGICVYDGASNQFAIAEEALNQITIVTIATNATSVSKASGRTLSMGLGPLANLGIEGITRDASNQCFYAVREKSPLAVYKVEELGGTNSVTTELFDAPAALGALCSDLSDLYYDPVTNRLLILSDESNLVVECSLAGEVLATLSVSEFEQPEGLTLTADRQRLYVIGEPNEAGIYNVVENQLRVQFPASTTEGGGVVTGVVSVVNPPGSNLTVQLTSSDTTEITVPASVVIPGAQLSVTFALTVVDDTIVDGTQTASVSVAASGYVSGTNRISVLDDDRVDLTLSVPALVAEGSGAHTAYVFVARAPKTNLTVQLLSSDTTEVTVPPAVVIVAGETGTVFALTVVDDLLLDGGRVAGITAAATNAATVTNFVTVVDNETAELTLVLPAGMREGDPAVTNGGALYVIPPPDEALTVAFVPVGLAEFLTPSSVVVGAGVSNVTFTVSAVDDGRIDGSQIGTVRVDVAGWPSGFGSMPVEDNEPRTLSLSLPAIVTEGAGVLVNTASVTIAGTLTSNLLVALASDDTSELMVPSSVTITAGTTRAWFALTLPNDGLFTLQPAVAVSAQAAGFTNASGALVVRENDAGTNYVALGGAPNWPYTTWDTAATNIQDAIDVMSSVATVGFVVVSNGVYDVGSRVVGPATTHNRIVVPSGITVMSLNGAAATVLRGGGSATNGPIRCAYLMGGASLWGFTLTNGVTAPAGTNDSYGGGAWCETTNAVIGMCIIGGNAAAMGGGTHNGSLRRCQLAWNSANAGGGAHESFLENCIVHDNRASAGGGGVYDGIAVNCTIVSNSADVGGGAAFGILYNSIIVFNSATTAPNHSEGDVAYCCTTPDVLGGDNIVTEDPRLRNVAARDYRLTVNSPCTNRGDTLNAAGLQDMNGRARIAGGQVDLGAYEYDGNVDDSDGDTMADVWEAGYGLDPTNAADGVVDGDGDGQRNVDEFVADTDPGNGAAWFRIEAISNGPPIGVVFQSSAQRVYTLKSSEALTGGVWNVVPGEADVPGAGGTQMASDTNGLEPAAMYRVQVALPEP